MSRVMELSIDSLLPIQAAGVEYTPLPNVYEACASQEPVTALLYDADKIGSTYLLLDGHHRAYRAYLLGKRSIMGNVMMSDEDVQRTNLGSLVGCRTIMDVKNRYHSVWLPLVKSQGISGISTLPIKPSRRSRR